MRFSIRSKKAQTAIEYMLLFTLGAIIVFIAFKNMLPTAQERSGEYYTAVANAIMGEPPPAFVPIPP